MLKECRRCGAPGHFAYVHDVEEPDLRRRIVATLGSDIFNPHSVSGPYAAALERDTRGNKRGFGEADGNDIQRKLVRLSREGGGGASFGPMTKAEAETEEEESYDDWYAS